MILFFSGDVGMRKIRFINVSSSSADRRWELVPITPDRDPSSAGAIHDNSSALINYFFPPHLPPRLLVFFSSFFFRSHSRSKTARTSRLFTAPASGGNRSPWMAFGRREANRLLSSIKCHRRGQTPSAKSRRFFFLFFLFSLRICRWRASATRTIKKSSRKKFFSKERRDLKLCRAADRTLLSFLLARTSSHKNIHYAFLQSLFYNMCILIDFQQFPTSLFRSWIEFLINFTFISIFVYAIFSRFTLLSTSFAWNAKFFTIGRKLYLVLGTSREFLSRFQSCNYARHFSVSCYAKCNIIKLRFIDAVQQSLSYLGDIGNGLLMEIEMAF